MEVKERQSHACGQSQIQGCLFIYKFMTGHEYDLAILNSFICSVWHFLVIFFLEHILPLQVWAVNLFCFY